MKRWLLGLWNLFKVHACEVTEDEIIFIQFVKSEYLRTILSFKLGKQHKVAKILSFHISKQLFPASLLFCPLI